MLTFMTVRELYEMACSGSTMETDQIEYAQLQGWVRTNRNNGSIGFIELNDGTYFRNAQLVYSSDLANFQDVSKYLTGTALTVTVGGLLGGHSGAEIDKGRGNANLLMGRVLYAVSEHTPLRLVSVAGGLKDNAIPRESRAVIIVTDAAAAQAAISDMDAALRHEYAAADPDVFVRSDAARPQQLPMDEASTQRAVCMLCCLPNGVQAMSRDIPGLVQTSLNLGILTTDANTVQASFCVRSSVATQKEMLVARLRCLMAQLGGTVTVSGDYPAWEYRKDSPLRERMVAVFREQYGRDPKVEAIHAGVECGLFAGKLPGLDCVSFGPDLTEIHTCRERMHIASVQRVWRYTLEVLRRCK